MIIGNFTKQPADELDYDVDCSRWLIANDTISTVVISIDGAGLVNPSTLISSNRFKVWLSGGMNGTSYKVTATITTDGGRVKQVEFKVKVKDY